LPKARRDRGFTLLEVLIAFAIAAAALASLFHLFSTGFLMQSEADRLTAAVALAETQLALAEQGALSSDEARQGRTADGLAWRRTILPLAPPMAQAGGETPLDAYEIQVTVSWGGLAKPKSITLRSLALGRRS
jgi:general secretion pathway protein I